MKALLLLITPLFALSLNAQIPPELYPKIDSLEKVIEQSTHDTITVNALREWDNLVYRYDPQQDMELLLEIQFICQVNLDEDISQKERVFFELQLSNCLNSLGVVYTTTGAYSEALQSHFEVLRFADKTDNQYERARSYNNIGIVYNLLEMPDSAMSNYLRAYRIASDIDTSLMAQALGNIASMQAEEGLYEEAIENFFQCLNLFEREGEGSWDLDIATTYNSIGETYLKMGDNRKANKYLKLGLKMREEIGSPGAIAKSQISVGDYFYANDDLNEAIKYNVLALMNANSIGDLATEKQACDNLYFFHKENDNPGLALKYFEKSVLLQDSIDIEESSDFALRKNMIHEFEKRTLTDSLKHEADLTIAREKRQKAVLTRRWTIFSSIVVLAFLLILVWVISKRLKITRRQNLIIESQKSQIVESIEYSRQIQKSLLPPIEELEQHFQKVFVYYDPKDIVSGDFYWFKNFGQFSVLAVVDCTGHGVPGGFMSTLGSLLMDKIIFDNRHSPSEILTLLSEELIRVLHQDKDGAIQDGMDMSLCLIDKEKKKVHFSGARNALLVFENNEFKKYRADLLPVGGNYSKKGQPIDRDFRNETIQLGEDAWIIMYTDGYIEQLGQEGLPMNSKQFEDRMRKALEQEESDDIVMVAQIELGRWQGTTERNDDICIIGFKI